MEIGLFLAGCLVFPTLHFLSVNSLPRILPGRPKDLYLAISTRVVSFVQALCATCVGLQVILTCEDIMKDRYPSVYYYAWFGLSYFYYDLGAMFLETYQQKGNFWTTCETFISKKYLLVLHHVFLPLFGFPVIVFLRHGIGDFFVGCIFIAEMSTPFVCANAIMSRLGWQSSMFYKVNGFLLAISFFFARIFIFPFMYWSYARYSKLSVWHVPFRIPLHCNLSCLGLLSLQMVWFIAIIRRITRFFSSKSSVQVRYPNGIGMMISNNNCMSNIPNGKCKL